MQELIGIAASLIITAVIVVGSYWYVEWDRNPRRRFKQRRKLKC